MRHGNLLETFLELVRIDSESGNERAVCDFIKKKIGGFASGIIEDDTGLKIDGNCGNLLLHIAGNCSGAPVILLNAHMDTVKPGVGIIPVIDGDVIRSSGETVLGADDKAGLAVIIELVRILKEENRRHGDLQLVITVSEEKGLLGARNLDRTLLKSDFGFSLDCAGPAGTIYNSSPSHDNLKAIILGRAAHAGMEPEKGISAIRVASLAVSRMKLGRIDFETTANIGIIHGGLAVNIIPDTAILEGEARSHNPEKLKRQLDGMSEALHSAALECGAEVDVEISHEYSSYNIDESSPPIDLMKRAALSMNITPSVKASGGGSDANIMNEYGIQIVPIGTGMRKCHTKEETLSISELEEILKWVLAAVELAAR